ncbi:NAD(P)/FAD-dependent oxidoreductase [Paraburkholderia sp.]|uniref:NAD(P)/FAD-dependent oxidoreductase n=1 Tax=Paraburkholderia sp. TaxID=1926495 RepID=UPI0039E46904
MDSVIVIGAGQAAMQLASTLRDGGYRGRLLLVGDEPGLPYQRPPLSKAYLAGAVTREELVLSTSKSLEKSEIELRSGVRVCAIDRAAARIELEDGERVAYDQLVLATGSRNRLLMVPGCELAGVRQLRTLAEADALATALDTARSVAVIGAGFIGLEFAALAAQRGLAVTVIEAGARPMGRAVSPEMSGMFRDIHERAGIRFRFGTTVTRIDGRAGAVISVRTSAGEQVAADLVLVGIGVLPNTELAAEAGLRVADGVEVDTHLCTCDPAISAIGDCARFPSRFSRDEWVRIESVQNAIDQARTVANRLLGQPYPYGAVPWFWSEQGAYRLQIAGLTAFHDTTVVHGDAEEGASILCFRAGRLIGVETLNRPREHMAARKLLTLDAALTPDMARQPDFDLIAHAQRNKAHARPGEPARTAFTAGH